MSFIQKIVPDEKQLLNKLTVLLHKPINSLSLEFQGQGSTGGVFRVGIEGQFYILKLVTDNSFYRFYKDVLESYQLNHPKVYGEVVLPTATFLLMDWIDNVTNEWKSEDFVKSIRWLANKDLKIKDKLTTLSNNPYISQKGNSLSDVIEESKLNIGKAIDKLPVIFNKSDVSKVFEFFDTNLHKLSSSFLTLVHNDFVPYNILITEQGEIYVIDWTGPFIGSAALDLVQIIKSAPEELENELLELYEHLTQLSISEEYKVAKFLAYLGHVNWRLKRHFRGDDKWDEIKDEVVENWKRLLTAIL